ncbi:MAG: molybdate ABC transporter substrate-binding protein [Zhongshania sp.]|uniref:molybdate ABC transporter substrate-binding protein n=1 Tax=Zhongshania sp. TaxID=1971902 RepID=UPI0026308296|nr:molybdate ABC transporter substrate-binding protein [Zhongshania sp.]MDF1692393.1 molybdate ABC transporter substrate-binding protein [Zhongshania sp.]
MQNLRLALLSCILWFSGFLQADTVRVALASNFAAPMREIARLFELESGHQVDMVVSSSGKIFAQIRYGAPFDVFLSADASKPSALVAKGLAVADSQFSYAIGRLVLWSPKPTLFDNSPAILRGSLFKTLALANPLHAPYGEAAVEVLSQLGLYEALAGKIVRGENIAQTFQFISTGNAELGFVALSQLRDRRQVEIGSQWLVPATMHSPIRQDAVLLTPAADKPAALEFMQFLQSAPIRELISASGYLLAD